MNKEIPDQIARMQGSCFISWFLPDFLFNNMTTTKGNTVSSPREREKKEQKS